ncbi:MAG: electron transport complex subunit RsxE [Defluviitaleaceae bacterium]|nr:electron transport complex subunit RsxE [Defluviitaleaceae bacterium]
MSNQVSPTETVNVPTTKYNYKALLTDGILKENPVFKYMLALCPALAITSNTFNSFGLGIITLIVLVTTNTAISIIGRFVPNEIRIPIYITVIAVAVTIMEMLTHAFMPALFSALGLFIALVVSNCLVLGRAEAFASKNSVVASFCDGLGNGLGFLFAMIVLGFFRELLGTGAIDFDGIFGFRLFPQEYAIPLFIQPMGAFATLGVIVGITASVSILKNHKKTQKKGA